MSFRPASVSVDLSGAKIIQGKNRTRGAGGVQSKESRLNSRHTALHRAGSFFGFGGDEELINTFGI